MKLLAASTLILLGLAAAPVEAKDYDRTLRDSVTSGLLRGDRLMPRVPTHSFQLTVRGDVHLSFQSFLTLNHYGTGFTNIIMQRVSIGSSSLTQVRYKIPYIHRLYEFKTERIRLVQAR